MIFIVFIYLCKEYLRNTFFQPSFFIFLVVPVNGHVEMKPSLTPPLITHTAATPMPVPKLPVAGDPILGFESRQGSNISIDPACYDKSPVSTRSVFSATKSTWHLLRVSKPLSGHHRTNFIANVCEGLPPPAVFDLCGSWFCTGVMMMTDN